MKRGNVDVLVERFCLKVPAAVVEPSDLRKVFKEAVSDEERVAFVQKGNSLLNALKRTFPAKYGSFSMDWKVKFLSVCRQATINEPFIRQAQPDSSTTAPSGSLMKVRLSRSFGSFIWFCSHFHTPLARQNQSVLRHFWEDGMEEWRRFSRGDLIDAFGDIGIEDAHLVCTSFQDFIKRETIEIEHNTAVELIARKYAVFHKEFTVADFVEKYCPFRNGNQPIHGLRTKLFPNTWEDAYALLTNNDMLFALSLQMEESGISGEHIAKIFEWANDYSGNDEAEEAVSVSSDDAVPSSAAHTSGDGTRNCVASFWEEELADYRAGYPKLVTDRRNPLTQNVDFYQNAHCVKKSYLEAFHDPFFSTEPVNEIFEETAVDPLTVAKVRELRRDYFSAGGFPPIGEFFGNYAVLDKSDFIDLLFPVQNAKIPSALAQRLQKSEIQLMKSDPVVLERLKRSYVTVLDWLGLELANELSGEIQRSGASLRDLVPDLIWSKLKATQHDRYCKLAAHNCEKVLTMMQSLGEFGFEQYKEMFCTFMIEEIFISDEKETLKNCRWHVPLWVRTLKRDSARTAAQEKLELCLSTAP